MPPSRLTQIRALIYYELLMNWRRGGLRLLAVLALGLPPLGFFIAGGDSTGVLRALPDAAAQVVRTGQALTDQVFLVVIAVFLAPLLLAEIIPLDRQYRMREILDALPLAPGVYLAGKVLHTWLALGVLFTLSSLLSAALAWYLLGPFDLGIWLTFYWAGVLPLGLSGALFGIACAARQATRQRAVLAGLLAVALTLALSMLLPVQEFLLTGLMQGAFAVMYPERLAEIQAAVAYPSPISASFALRLLATAVGLGLFSWIASAYSLRSTQEA